MAERSLKLEIRDMTKRYDNGDGVEHINLKIYEGEIVTMLGPSGCGKSTILRTIGGFLDVTDGDILIDNESIVKLPPEKRPTAMVFQSYNLWTHMTVYENLAFGLKLRKIPKDQIRADIDKHLKLVSMSGFEKKYPTQLSGGQQQRIAIARSLLLKPSVLLLDEPFSALDAKIRQQMREELKKIQAELGITVVFVTHDQEEAFAMSDRVVVMNQGRIEQIGTPQEIYEEPSNLYVARFVGEINILPARIMSVPGEGIYIADISGRRFTLRTSRPFVAGDRVNVLLRPEDIRVYAHDDERPEGPYLTGRIEETVYKGGDRGYPDRHTPGRSLPIRRRLPGGLVLAGRVTYDGAETGDGGGPWGTAGPPACFWHGVLRPPEEKAGRPEEAGTLPGMFDEERRSGRCPPRKAISD